MAAVDVNNSLKEACLETLGGILSANQDVRKASENQVQALEVTEGLLSLIIWLSYTVTAFSFPAGFGVYLVEIVLDQRHCVAARQLATVLLKQYVDNHWSSTCEEKFRPPETTNQVKHMIREMLPRALEDPNSKIRSGAAHAISAIAHWDWPDDWPSLFGTLMMCLTGGSQDALQGSMCVLSEITYSVDDKQMPQVTSNQIHKISHQS